ncbi:MAG: hypothetical protein LBF42_04330 [Puniceicoccales bacterium]|nr:hypothetical protein [Puniceicoccales bacterium]
MFGCEIHVSYDSKEADVKPTDQFERKTMAVPDSQLEYQRFIPQIGEVKKMVAGGIVLSRRKLGEGAHGVAEGVEFTNDRDERRVFTQKTINDVEEGRHEVSICSKIQGTVSALSRGEAAFWLGSIFIPRFIEDTVSGAGKFTNCYE